MGRSGLEGAEEGWVGGGEKLPGASCADAGLGQRAGGALGSGRADGAGANTLLGTWRLQESTVCFSDWRAGPLVQEGRTWKECPGLLEQGGLADCLCPRPWWELTFQLG